MDPPVLQEQEISDTLAFDNGPQFAEFCFICRKNDREEDQIVCEHCDYQIAHYYCIGYSVIPEVEWFCPRCHKEMQQRQKEDDERR